MQLQLSGLYQQSGVIYMSLNSTANSVVRDSNEIKMERAKLVCLSELFNAYKLLVTNFLLAALS